MKKTIIILSLLLATTATIAQSKDSSVKPIPPPQLNDSTSFISIKYIKEWLPTIESVVTVTEYNKFIQIIGDLVETSRKKWQEQEAKKKK